MKKNLSVLLFLLVVNLFAQNPDLHKMGQVSVDELSMSIYKKDSSASAVILDEKKFVYPSIKKKFNFTKEYYTRIKIFDQSAFSYANLNIYTYFNSKIENLEAITYNLDANGEIVKSKLNLEDVFKERLTKNTTLNKFVLPNVKVGSVIEYKYTVHRNNYKVHEFYFQGSIPSIKSEYTAYLSGYTNYNVRLIGYLKPDFSESIIKEKCIGTSKCIQIKYLLTDIPAFISEEYMTSKYNFISRLSFEEKYKDRFVKIGENSEWKSLDKWVKNTLENRFNKRSLYKRKLPDSILNEVNDLKRAKMVFYYIQDRFIAGDNSGKTFSQSYQERIASSSIINISLYNALKAARFENVKFVMLSTRKNGLPTKLHATLDDFNSDLVRIIINDEKYLLDAADKLLPFGVIPFESLNGDGRVFNFIKGSYWETISPIKSNFTRVKMNLSLNDGNMIAGKKEIIRNGYHALNTRRLLNNKSKEDYLSELESTNSSLEIKNYSNINLTNKEKPLKEVFDIKYDYEDTSITLSNLLNLNKINPFKLKNRNYPIDYGFIHKNIYTVSLNLPNDYEFDKIPTDLIVSLPNKGGSYIQKISLSGNTLNVYMKFQINQTVFLASFYEYLKLFYDKVLKSQNTLITFKKKL